MIRYISAAVILLAAAFALGGTLEIRKGQSTAVSTMTAAAFNAGVWTGWIEVGDKQSICFNLFHDYTGNAGVTMRCETSDDKTTAPDAGYDLVMLTLASGTATSQAVTYSHATGADARWNWCWDNLPGGYVNCKVDDTSGNNGTDTITVTYRLLTP